MKCIPLSANSTKWPSTLKQFVSKLPTNCLSMFDHFRKLVLKGLKEVSLVLEAKMVHVYQIGSLSAVF